MQQVRHFVAVADNLSFTKAAKELSLTQPALSQSISGLEKWLEVKLFERSTRGTVLSPGGKLLLAECRKILEAAQIIDNLAQSIDRDKKGTLHIAAMPALTKDVLPNWLTAYRRRCPNVEIEVSADSMNTRVDTLLLTGPTEILLSYRADTTLFPGIAQLHLGQQNLIFALSPEVHIEEDTVSPQELLTLPLIISPYPSSWAKVVEDVFDAIGGTPNIVMRTDFFENIIDMVEGGIGSSILPSNLGNEVRARGLQVKRLPLDARRLIRAYYRKDNLSPAAEEFLRLIRESLDDTKA